MRPTEENRQRTRKSKSKGLPIFKSSENDDDELLTTGISDGQK